MRSSTSVVDVGGPSPRARGRRGRVRPCLRRGGTIPARAGETRSLRALKRIPWDHPRARGGDPATISASRFFQGPSPRARGRPAHADIPLRVGGTIPARAGETSPRSSSARRRRDHPRARGGDPGRKRRPSWSSGPCPRARGWSRHRRRADRRDAVSPARAGETRWGRRWKRPTRDHPRARGGDTTPPGLGWRFTGPSPRARGRPAELPPGGA